MISVSGSAGSASEVWRVDIDIKTAPVAATNWSTLVASATALGGGTRDSSSAQNDTIGWDVWLTAGTWTFSLLHCLQTDRGIYGVSIDAVSVGTIDGYAAAPAFNTLGTIASIAVATSGKKRVALTMATKNASSSNFKGTIQAVSLVRTA